MDYRRSRYRTALSVCDLARDPTGTTYRYKKSASANMHVGCHTSLFDPMPNCPILDEQAISDVCRSYGVRRLELFGSGVLDPEHANDFDFLVDLEEVEPGKYAKAYFGLYEALQKITGKPVDLVTGRSIRNPYFRLSVNRNKRLLYEA